MAATGLGLDWALPETVMDDLHRRAFTADAQGPERALTGSLLRATVGSLEDMLRLVGSTEAPPDRDIPSRVTGPRLSSAEATGTGDDTPWGAALDVLQAALPVEGQVTGPSAIRSVSAHGYAPRRRPGGAGAGAPGSGPLTAGRRARDRHARRHPRSQRRVGRADPAGLRRGHRPPWAQCPRGAWRPARDALPDPAGPAWPVVGPGEPDVVTHGTRRWRFGSRAAPATTGPRRGWPSGKRSAPWWRGTWRKARSPAPGWARRPLEPASCARMRPTRP